MRRVFQLLLILSIVVLPLRAWAQQEADYLTDQAVFDAAWAKLTERMGARADLARLTVTPDKIEVAARAGAGGPRVDAWVVRRKGALLQRDVVSGPRAVAAGGPGGDVEGAFFSAAALPLDRLVAIAAPLLELAAFQDPGRLTEVSIGRQLVLLPSPSHGEVRWTIAAKSPRESARVEASVDGALFGLDISGTMRARNRNFFTQDSWPFADAQTGFEELIGAGGDVFEIRVLRGSITISTRRKGYPDSRTSISWDGGRFTRGLVDLPAAALAEGEPFHLADIPLALLPKAIATAWAQVEGRDQRLETLRAHSPDLTRGTHGLHWEITFTNRDAPLIRDSDIDTIVRLTPAGEVASVQLPAALRPKSDFVATDWLVWGAQSFAQGMKPDTPVFEAMFRHDRVEIKGLANGQPDMTQTLVLDADGFRLGREFPLMMETPNDLFKVGLLGGIEAATIDAIKQKAVDAVGIPGGEVYSLKVWSGGPFYQVDPNTPMFDVRVGLPPDHRTSGYAVFKFDGTFVEAFR